MKIKNLADVVYKEFFEKSVFATCRWLLWLLVGLVAFSIPFISASMILDACTSVVTDEISASVIITSVVLFGVIYLYVIYWFFDVAPFRKGACREIIDWYTLLKMKFKVCLASGALGGVAVASAVALAVGVGLSHITVELIVLLQGSIALGLFSVGFFVQRVISDVSDAYLKRMLEEKVGKKVLWLRGGDHMALLNTEGELKFKCEPRDYHWCFIENGVLKVK